MKEMMSFLLEDRRKRLGEEESEKRTLHLEKMIELLTRIGEDPRSGAPPRAVEPVEPRDSVKLTKLTESDDIN